MERLQDLFISHASPDKQNYVLPLARALADRGVTFWLDTAEVEWGDQILEKINRGLRNSRFMLLCLSRAFLGRPWPENEMAAALSLQNRAKRKRLLPLILNSKDEVLKTYPMIAALAYREFHGAEAVANDVTAILGVGKKRSDLIQIVVESVHTGNVTNIEVPPRATVEWLSVTATEQTGLSRSVDVGSFHPMSVRWVLVDASLRGLWEDLPRAVQWTIWGLFRNKGTTTRPLQPGETRIFARLPDLAQQLSAASAILSTNGHDRIEDFGVEHGTVFNLCAGPEAPMFYI